MLKIVVTYPNRTEERSILDAMATTSPNLSVQPVVSSAEILQARQVVNLIHVDEKVRDYIVDVVLATRDPKAYKLDFPGWIQYGASPRATIAMTLAARALAFLNGRAYVTPQDVKEVAHDVLQHRVTVTYEAEAENLSSRDIVQKILDTLPVP
jgi:MoxR-like ATPase